MRIRKVANVPAFVDQMTPEQVRSLTDALEIADAVQDVDFVVTYRPDGLEDGLFLVTSKAQALFW